MHNSDDDDSDDGGGDDDDYTNTNSNDANNANNDMGTPLYTLSHKLQSSAAPTRNDCQRLPSYPVHPTTATSPSALLYYIPPQSD